MPEDSAWRRPTGRCQIWPCLALQRSGSSISSPSSAAAWLALLLGIAIRTWAYAGEASLWLDEILLTRNIVGLPLGRLLTEPLYLDQVAPRGFLLAEKLAAEALGPSERALRLFPFLSSIAGLLLFHRLAARTLSGWAVPLAVALCALGIPFIRYGAEVKQYHLDATATILLLLVGLGLREREPGRGRLAAAAVAGLLIPWFSQASVLVMTGIGLALALEWLVVRDRGIGRVLAVVMPVWAASAAVAVALGRRSMTPTTREFMDDFWKGGFFPLPLDSVKDLGWLVGRAVTPFADTGLLRYPWPWLFVALGAAGVVRLWRGRREQALLLFGPLVAALGAAVAGEYPLSGRVMFYLLPIVLLAVAEGGEGLRRAGARVHPAFGAALAAAVLAPPTLALAEAPPPYDMESHRVMLSHLQRHRRAGDVVYVLPLTRIGALYYGPRYGLSPGEWTTGVCDRNDTRAYLRDVDRFRGVGRLWLLSSSPRPFRVVRATLQAYLSTIGVRLDSLSRPSLQFGTAALELYDLSDPARLAATSADSFPVRPMPADPRPGCRPWTRPSPLDTMP